jgi:hypothetical protein
MIKEVDIGPYIEMTYTPKNEVEFSKECEKHGTFVDSNNKAEFCPACGKKLKEMKTKIETHMDYDSLMEEIDPNEIYKDELWWVCEDEKPLILISNKYGNVNTEYGPYEITPKYIATALKEFKEYHKDLIEILEKRADTFYIEFGVIADYR